MLLMGHMRVPTCVFPIPYKAFSMDPYYCHSEGAGWKAKEVLSLSSKIVQSTLDF